MKIKLSKSLTSMIMGFAMLSTVSFANEVAPENMTSAEFLNESNGNGHIVLNEDVTLSDSLKIDRDYIIDLNGYTLKLTQPTNLFVNDANVTFKDGTINLDGVKSNADCILGLGHYGSRANLTLDSVELQANNYSSAYALIYVYNDSELNINNSVVNAKNEKSLSGGVIKTSNGKSGEINVTDSTLNFNNTARGFVDGTINIKDSAVQMKGLANGINSSANALDLTVDNSELTITGSIGRALTIDGSEVNVKNNSVLDFTKSLGGDIVFKSQGTVEVDKSSELNVETIKVDKAITDAGINLNDLIVSEGYDYEVDDKGNVIKKCNHVNINTVNEKEATCTQEGYTGDKVCADCDEVIEKGNIIPVIDHKFENGTCIDCDALDPNFKPEDTEKPGDAEEDTEEPGNTEKPEDIVNPEDSAKPEDGEQGSEEDTVKPEDSLKPESTIKPDNTVKPENNENNSENEIEAPKTGDDSILLTIGMFILSATGLVYLRKKECR